MMVDPESCWVKASDYDAKCAEVEQAERDEDQLLKERDETTEMADRLADAIAALTGVDIGEHSSGNCPWLAALEAAEEYPAHPVLREVADERARQDAKWGGPAHDDQHSVGDFAWFITTRTYGRSPSRQVFVEVAALAVAAIESLDRRAALAAGERATAVRCATCGGSSDLGAVWPGVDERLVACPDCAPDKSTEEPR